MGLNDIMFSSQLKKVINKDGPMRKVFRGFFCRNKLPKIGEIKTDSAFIINTDECSSIGEHWLLVFVDPDLRKTFWFDSFGESPSYYGSEFSRWLKQIGYKVMRRKKSIQAPESHYCGLFVLYFLYYLARNVSISKIYNSFFGSSKEKNDKLLSDFMWRKFRFNTKTEIDKRKSINRDKMVRDFLAQWHGP